MSKRRNLMEGATSGKQNKGEQEERNFTRARDDKYSSFRMKTDILQRFKQLADQRGIAFPGQLIHSVLEDYLDKQK